MAILDGDPVARVCVRSRIAMSLFGPFGGGDPSKPKGAQRHIAQRRTRPCRAFRFVENLLRIEYKARVLLYSILNYGIPLYKFRKHYWLASKIQAKEIMRGWFGFSKPKQVNDNRD